MRNINVSIEDSMHKSIRVLAAEMDISIRHLVINALEAYLEAQKEKE